MFIHMEQIWSFLYCFIDYVDAGVRMLEHIKKQI